MNTLYHLERLRIYKVKGAKDHNNIKRFRIILVERPLIYRVLEHGYIHKCHVRGLHISYLC